MPSKSVTPDRQSTRLNSTHNPFFLMPSFFFNDTATTEIYTLSLHDALPIYSPRNANGVIAGNLVEQVARDAVQVGHARSAEHTSELHSQSFFSYAVFFF